MTNAKRFLSAAMALVMALTMFSCLGAVAGASYEHASNNWDRQFSASETYEIKDYADLAAIYGDTNEVSTKSWIYLASEFLEKDPNGTIEIDNETWSLTDHYVEPGQELYVRYYIKSNCGGGLFQIQSLYSRSFFDVNAYTDHCNKYKRYWDWVKNRNEERYVLDKDYGFNAKNISQAVRLFNIAIEVAEGKGLILNRRNIDRELLLSIKNHEMSYNEVIAYVESLKKKMEDAFNNSTIPDSPDQKKLEEILIRIRRDFYEVNNINISC